jgi:FtsH-binding integral membrane protein
MQQETRNSRLDHDGQSPYHLKMARRLALALLTASTVSVVIAYALVFLPGGARNGSTYLMAFGIAAMAVAMMTLGSVREGERLGGLKWVFAFVFVVIAGGFTAALLLPDKDSASSKLLLGLPLRAAIIVFGVGFLPVFVLPFAYARWFDRRSLSPEELAELKRLAAESMEKSE